MRLFIAIELSPKIKDALMEVIQFGKDHGVGYHIKWQDPKTIHLTIRFIGEVSESLVHSLKDPIAALVKQFQSFDLKVQGISAFPNLKRPRVIWVGTLVPDYIGNLRHELDRFLEMVGVEPDNKSFHPHITLGRVKKSTRDELPLFQRFAKTDFGSMHVKTMILFKSELTKEGAIHTPITMFDFN